jgi:stearoyl-CoA desaturase (delta-9 desaturase)
MGKGPGKSSATSATRKKHAKKYAPPPEEPAPRTKKEKKARGKKEQKQKIYIPPVKPAPVQPDPLETTGLAHSLPPELLIVLRSFNKKAEVTKIRALEELQVGWVDKSGEDEMVEYNLVQMLPVWVRRVALHVILILNGCSSITRRLCSCTRRVEFVP